MTQENKYRDADKNLYNSIIRLRCDQNRVGTVSETLIYPRINIINQPVGLADVNYIDCEFTYTYDEYFEAFYDSTHGTPPTITFTLLAFTDNMGWCSKRITSRNKSVRLTFEKSNMMTELVLIAVPLNIGIY